MFVCLLAGLLPASVSAQKEGSKTRHNELTLARLRPGKDKLAAAVALYGPNYLRVVPDSDDILAWVDKEKRQVLRIELAGDRVIQTVTLSALDPLLAATAGKQEATATLPVKLLVSGSGLALGDPCNRVVKLYGAPGSTGPSTQQERELELLFYAFDWAGSDVPQVMEITCDHASRRVVEIMLASPSL